MVLFQFDWRHNDTSQDELTLNEDHPIFNASDIIHSSTIDEPIDAVPTDRLAISSVEQRIEETLALELLETPNLDTTVSVNEVQFTSVSGASLPSSLSLVALPQSVERLDLGALPVLGVQISEPIEELSPDSSDSEGAPSTAKTGAGIVGVSGLLGLLAGGGSGSGNGAEGPAGPPGPAGPSGPEGPKGPAGTGSGEQKTYMIPTQLLSEMITTTFQMEAQSMPLICQLLIRIFRLNTQLMIL